MMEKSHHKTVVFWYYRIQFEKEGHKLRVEDSEVVAIANQFVSYLLLHNNVCNTIHEHGNLLCNNVCQLQLWSIDVRNKPSQNGCFLIL